MFEHGFLPLRNVHSLRHPNALPRPPPPNNDRECDHNAILAHQQDRNSHYTTDHTNGKNILEINTMV